MASENSFRVDALPPADEWEAASAADRKAYLRRLGEIAMERKHWELDRALDANTGERMPARQKPRDDGADGPVLTPHNRQSRSHRYMRASAGAKHVTIWWSHGWGTILGYHADGVVIGAYKRDVIGLTPAGERKVAREALDWWRRNHPKKKAAAKPKAPPRPPRDEAPARVPIGGRRGRTGPRPIGDRPGPQPAVYARPKGRGGMKA